MLEFVFLLVWSVDGAITKNVDAAFTSEADCEIFAQVKRQEVGMQVMGAYAACEMVRLFRPEMSAEETLKWIIMQKHQRMSRRIAGSSD